MTNHVLSSDKLYILSGISASGKSTFIKNLIKNGMTKDSIISTDSIRKNLLGYSLGTDDFGTMHSLYGWELGQVEIFDIIDKMLRIRLKEKLPTFFDATNLTDEIRRKYVDIALEYGMESEILIFENNVEELKHRLSNRLERFSPEVIDMQAKKFQNKSKFNFKLIKQDDYVFYMPKLISNENIDVIGDIHGLYNEMASVLKSTGWNIYNNELVHNDKNRKLLFLGDIVDRGPDSIKVLDLVMKNVRSNRAYFLMGNHEHKFFKTVEDYLKNNIIKKRSFSSAETFADFLKLGLDKQKDIYEFLKFSPAHFSFWYSKTNNETINLQNFDKYSKVNREEIFKVVFTHADIDYYNPFGMPSSVAMYGRSRLNAKKDTDKKYNNNFLKKLTEHISIRGHIPNTSIQDNVYSLDDRQAFRGNMMVLNFSNFLNDIKNNNYYTSKNKIFENNTTKEKTTFDYDEYLQNNKKLIFDIESLVKLKLVKFNEDESSGLKIFKYHNKVFLNNLWHKNPVLLKCRGLVMDIAGNIAQHPFDKIFNFGENKAGNKIPLDKEVQIIEKVNGFLGCITKHPFKNELLVSTTGSLNSDYVEYIKDFITNDLKVKFLKYFENNNQTLMFEVIHAKDHDKHIIKYQESDFGLWLIGARGKNETDKIVSELSLDLIAKQLDLRRPKYFNEKFDFVINNLKKSDLEGYIIRDLQTGDPLIKIKTDNYLVTKFIGRMGENNIKMMFKNTEKFKEEKVEEEFFDMVDDIVGTFKVDEFTGLTQEKRVSAIRDIIQNNRRKTLETKIKINLD